MPFLLVVWWSSVLLSQVWPGILRRKMTLQWITKKFILTPKISHFILIRVSVLILILFMFWLFPSVFRIKPAHWPRGHSVRHGPRDLGSIPGRVIPKTQKMVLDVSLLNTQQYKVRIKGKVSNPGKGVTPSTSPRYSSYWKGSLLIILITYLRSTSSVNQFLSAFVGWIYIQLFNHLFFLHYSVVFDGKESHSFFKVMYIFFSATIIF